MHAKTILSTAIVALTSLVSAYSTYTVTNNCEDKKYLTLSNNDLGVLQLNAELPGGTSRNYYIDSQHSLAIANSTNYWDASTYKLVLGTNTVSGTLYYAIGTANGYPLTGKNFAYTSNNQNCPPITVADGQTKGCPDTGVAFTFTLCS